jgi:catechol 2,3-dioxygenase
VSVSPRDPEEATATGAPAVAALPPQTRMGAVHLSVADLDRSIGFYESAVGLRVHRREGARAALAAGGEDLLVLREEPGAKPARGYAGLYHFALLLPERRDLATWVAHAARDRLRLTGMSDHFVSEAVYLADPDEHGIEIYWDRPREVWEGKVAERLTTEPLDVRSLLAELDDPARTPFDRLPDGTVMGHVHLRVAQIAPTVGFYRDVLGFALMAALGREAAFLSAGGYHHHLGANTWESAGAPQPPSGFATLERVTIVLPDAAARDEVAERAGGRRLYDPSGNPIVLAAEGDPAMPERHRVALLLLHHGTPRDKRALAELLDALPDGSKVGKPDELGVFEVEVDADDQEHALQRVWDAVAASGTDDHLVFVEHPELPEHWRRFSRPVAGGPEAT